MRVRRWIAIILGLVVIASLFVYGSYKRNHQGELPDVPNSVENPFLSQYAGEYTVEVAGYSDDEVESYVLQKNGTATWMLIVPDDSQGTRTASKKYGTWTATEGRIAISIQGNTGTIKEEYNYLGNRFNSTTSAGRYLNPTE